MIREIQLYIGDQRVELFGDETISITDSIKNAKDISKVFTTFSQQFTVPASKENNKIFKHFYNYDIDNAYAFDARVKVAARLEINYLPFRNGRLKLDGVDLRNNAPYAYRITFYGSVVDLKDLIGEDKLPSLSTFENVNLEYDLTTLIAALQQNATGDYPLALITAGQRLYYDSEADSQGSGNLYWSDAGVAQGLKPQQLKYAVKLSKLIDAILTEYSITAADNTFFNPSETNDLDELYMWLHRKNDVVEIPAGVESKVPFDQTFPTNYFYIGVDSNLIVADDPSANETIRFIASASNTGRYDLIIRKNGEVVAAYENVSGTISPTFSTGNYVQGDVFNAHIRTYEETVTFSSIQWQALNDSTLALAVSSTQTTYLRTFFFNVGNNLPEMKIIDFLSGIFQLFNLVAYVDDDGDLITQTLDEFYRIGNSYDISKYIDISRSTVDSALPYSEIFFKYKDTKTILAEQHYQEVAQVDPATGRGPFEWGGVEYATDNNLSGEIYKVEPPFHHAKYEKLLDASNQINDTQTQVGYFVTDNEESYLGSPLLFYVVPQAINVHEGKLSVVKGESRLNSPTITGPVNMPSNSKSFDPEVSEANIHFNAEINEFAGVEFEDTLFKRYYEKYIQSVFNQRNRLTKVTAYLPVSILREIALNDTIIINGRSYIINSMQINVNTGKTSFELLNKYTVNAIWGQVEQTWSSINTNWGVI